MSQLINSLLEKDPARRPSPKQLLENSYVKLFLMSFSQVEEGENKIQ